MNEMTMAAKKGEIYHLWWHPHNFGINLYENMNNLKLILEHFKKLQAQYAFGNQTMKGAAGF